MKYKTFSRLKDEKLPVIGFGCWSIGKEWNNINDQASIEAIRTAISLGITFFDTAPIYGKGHSESVLGQAIKGIDRSKLFIASKCGLIWDAQQNVDVNLSRKSLMIEIDQSLDRLGIDYIDLWQCHWPDTKTPLDETIEAMEEIRSMGKIRYLGLSNYSLQSLKKADHNQQIASFQGLYNLLEQNPSSYHNIPLTYKTKDEVIPYCEANGLMYLPYSPLFQGLLTGSFKATGNFDKLDKRSENPKLSGESLQKLLVVVEELKTFASQIGRPLSQIAVNWLINQKTVGPIIAGLDKKEYTISTAAALDWTLNPEMESQIQHILDKHELE